MLGGLVSYIVKKYGKNDAVHQRGILAASGLVAGDACMGVILAFLTVSGITAATHTPLLPDFIGIGIFFLLALGLGWVTLKSPFGND